MMAILIFVVFLLIEKYAWRKETQLDDKSYKRDLKF